MFLFLKKCFSLVCYLLHVNTHPCLLHTYTPCSVVCDSSWPPLATFFHWPTKFSTSYHFVLLSLSLTIQNYTLAHSQPVVLYFLNGDRLWRRHWSLMRWSLACFSTPCVFIQSTEGRKGGMEGWYWGDSLDSHHAWAAATSYSFSLQAFPVFQHPN